MGHQALSVAHEARLISLSPELLGAAGFDGRLKLHNPAWTRTLGWSDEELESARYLDFVHPDDRDAARAVVERLEASDAAAELLCRVRRRDGEYRHILWAAQSAPEDGCLYLCGRDVTERRILDAELELRAERLERTNSELQDFAYIASHDLSEPLRMITSYLQLLQRRYEGRLDETADEFIHYAVDGADRMKALIEDLLQYSRVGSAEVRRDPVDADAVLESVLLSLEGSIIERGARITRRSLGMVRADPTQLAQLLQNLIGNAIKFGREGVAPHVHIDTEPGEDGWHAIVRDNGIGISERDTERIFKMFSRLNPREEYEGTGIGLAICRRIADRHGGRVWVTSHPGAGSTFHVTIPGTA